MATRPKHQPAKGQPDPSPTPGGQGQGQRLQKVLAAAGVGSRRQCEQLIQQGRVEVDGQVVMQLGTRVEPARQQVRVDGQLLRPAKHIYLVVNKPAGVLSTSRDPAGRTRVLDLIGTDERLFTVGRLDMSSEGLLLITNDGNLAHQLLHPRFQVERIYEVVVAGEPTRESLDTLRRGVHLAEGRVRVARLRVKRRQKRATVLEMVLTEGRNREIRRMAARIGHKVMSLKRIGFGPLRLGELPPGAYRSLTHQELQKLQQLVRHNRRPDARDAPTGPVAGGHQRARQKGAARRASLDKPARASQTRRPRRTPQGKQR